MDKKELVEKIESLPSHTSITSFRPYVDKKIILGLISQLDEPQKVVVPQFVADYIDISKFYVRTLHYALENSPEKVNLWLCENEINRQNTFARAWLDGYEVEKENRYLVKMKNIDINSAYLKHQLQNNHWYWGNLTECGAFSPYHTKKELEANDFGWVFDCDVVEVEEVE